MFGSCQFFFHGVATLPIIYDVATWVFSSEIAAFKSQGQVVVYSQLSFHPLILRTEPTRGRSRGPNPVRCRPAD